MLHSDILNHMSHNKTPNQSLRLPGWGGGGGGGGCGKCPRLRKKKKQVKSVSPPPLLPEHCRPVLYPLQEAQYGRAPTSSCHSWFASFIDQFCVAYVREYPPPGLACLEAFVIFSGGVVLWNAVASSSHLLSLSTPRTHYSSACNKG